MVRVRWIREAYALTELESGGGRGDREWCVVAVSECCFGLTFGSWYGDGV